MKKLGEVTLLLLPLLSLYHGALGLAKGFVPAYDPLCNIGYAQERYMAVAWDCTGWIDCVSKVGGGFAAVWTLCPPNLSFSAISRNCVAKSLCPDQKTTSVAFCQSGISPNMAFKHPDSCAMYYQCNNTNPHANLRVYENECDADMMFDEKDGVCKTADLVNCGDRATPSGTCGYRKLCKLPDCQGLPNGYYPLDDAPFSSEYYECVTGQFIAIRKCSGAGEVFDPATRQCSQGVISTSAQAYCAANPRAKFPDPASCSLFYDCSKYEHDSNLYPYQAECVYLYLYDIKVQRCVYFLQAECQSRPEPRAPCEYRRGHCYGRNHDHCISCDANCVTLPDGLNVYPGRSLTPYYLLCAAGRTINVKVCTDNQVFDPIVGGCVGQIATDTMRLFCEANPGTIIAHPGECAMYYDCAQTAPVGNFKIYEKECKYPNLFDAETKACVDFFNVTCENKREPISPCDYLQYQCTDKSCVPCNQVLPDCTGREDGYYTVPRWELTSSYIACQNFRFMFRYDCPPGEIFDILDRRCAKTIKQASMDAYCTKYPAGRIANPTHCGQYYDCAAPLSSRLVECPYPQLFSYEYMECRPFEEVDCGRRIDFKNPCDYKRFYSCSSPDPSQCPPCEALYPSCHLQPEAFMAALPGTSNQYYVCNRGRAILKACKTTFNSELKRCMDPLPATQKPTPAFTSPVQTPRPTYDPVPQSQPRPNSQSQPRPNPQSQIQPYPQSQIQPYPSQPTPSPIRTLPPPLQTPQPVYKPTPELFQPQIQTQRPIPVTPPTQTRPPTVIQTTQRPKPLPQTTQAPPPPVYRSPINPVQNSSFQINTGPAVEPNSVKPGFQIQTKPIAALPPKPKPTTTTPTPQPRPGEPGFDINIYCSNNRYDIFPHHVSCAKFYNCMVPTSIYEKYVMECPYPQLYDASTRTCRYFTDVRCAPNLFVPVAPCDYDKYNAECGRGTNCPPCEVNNPSCKGLPNGPNPYPGDALSPRYIKCQSGRTMSVINCQPETFYDPIDRMCSYELKNGSIDAFCRQNPTSTFQHPFNCAQFINCSQTGSLVIECGYPRLYSKTGCVDFKQVDCRNKYKPVAPCEYAQNRRCPGGKPSCEPCEQRIPSCVGLPNDKQPYPGRTPSRLFVLCDSGRTSAVMQCQKNIFNPTTKTCSGAISNADVASICARHPTSVFPDPVNCAKYYNCSMKEIILDKPFHAECRYPDFFSMVTNKCESFLQTTSAGGCGTRYQPVEPCEYHEHCPTYPNCDSCKRNLPSCNKPNLKDPGVNLIPNNSVQYASEWYFCYDKRTIAYGVCARGQYYNSSVGDCTPLPV